MAVFFYFQLEENIFPLLDSSGRGGVVCSDVETYNVFKLYAPAKAFEAILSSCLLLLKVLDTNKRLMKKEKTFLGFLRVEGIFPLFFLNNNNIVLTYAWCKCWLLLNKSLSSVLIKVFRMNLRRKK